MNKTSKKIDAYFIGLFLEIFIVIALLMIQRGGDYQILNFVMLCITFFIVITTYTGGIVVGLMLSSVVVFLYASYIFYINLVSAITINTISYIWMISIPIIAFTSGKLSKNITSLQERNRKLQEEYKNLVTIDEDTGLGNEKLFYRDLEREISRSQRHKVACTLMLIKLPYHKEIQKIIGEEKTKELLQKIRDISIASTRNEDERYNIEDDTIAIIMPNTDKEGADVVKNRIKSEINQFNLKLREKKEYVDIDTKIAVFQYKNEIKTALEFKFLAEEELQYDV